MGQTLRALTRAGVIDLMCGDPPPLDCDTVTGEAMNAVYDDVELSVADLPPSEPPLPSR